MLGAVSLRPWEQSLFKLVLTMHSTKSEIPPSLAAHFNEVLEETKRLVGDPSQISGEVSSEALDLALELQGCDALAAEINSIPELSAISPQMAEKILTEMEKCPAC
jgi:hypothetical protein